MKIKFLPGCILAASMALTTSCSDFLTEDPKGQLTPDNVFKKTESLSMSLNSLYNSLLSYQCNSNSMIVQCMGDDVTSSVGSNKSAYLSSDVFATPTDQKGVEKLWSDCYNIIKNANYTIDCAKYIGATKEDAGEYLGQAYFWRAYAYYSLVRTWGPVPLAPEAVLSVDVKNNTDAIPLSSVEEIYNKIVADLKSAEECNLPAQYTGANKSVGGSNIYVSKQAVKSMLAAVYMSMAGYPLNKTENYALAADKAKEALDVMDQTGANSLLTDWRDVYNYGNNYSKECILGLYYNPVTGSWGDDDSQLTSCHTILYYDKKYAGWGDFIAERRFWAQYPDGPRKKAVYGETLLSLAGNNVDWWATTDGNPLDAKRENAVITDYRPMFTGFAVNQDATGAAVKAPFDCTKPIYAGMTLGKTHQLIRYAEVLCWFAEASARSGKYHAEARAALKKIRQRAYSDQAVINAVDNMSDEQLAEAAWNEHRYEVAGNVLGMVTCREDLFRLNKLKDQYDYRSGAQGMVLIPAGTITRSEDKKGQPFTYSLKEDLKVSEENVQTETWKGDASMYSMYPPTQVEKNPNLKR